MTRAADKPARSQAVPELLGASAPEEVDDAKRLVRDMYALSTLPAMWMGAEPVRIGESLLAALEATIRPALCYFRIGLEPGGDAEAIELAHVDSHPLEAPAAAALGERIRAWAATHDPDDLLVLEDSPAGRPLRVWVHPLGHDARGGVLAAGFAAAHGPSDTERTLLNLGATQAIVACKNAAVQRQAERARQEAQALHSVTQMLAAELDLETVVQKSVDAARQLTGAGFAAFFRNEANERGEPYTLYTLSGAPREAFESFGMPRNTQLFGPTFHGTHTVRIDDVLRDPRYGTMPPHHGMPRGHLPVRSYLAVPVISRSGEVLGGLFFGHPEPGVFGEQAERIASGVARQAAVAIDNARLFSRAEEEIRQRKRAEEALRASEASLRKDIRERERAEQALREQKENLETLLETLPIGVFIAQDPEGRRIAGNRAASELLRMPDGANLSRSAPPGERPPHFKTTRDGHVVPPENLPVQRAARGEVVEAEDLDVEFDDGTVVHTLISARPLYDPAGRPRGAVASILDITGLKSAESALRAADRRKDEFLATLAHELRNPLAPIRSSLDLMKHASGDERVLRSARDTIERQVEHLVRLVDDLLDVSRITRDRLELRRSRVELAAVVRQAVETCQPIAEREGQAIEVQVPEAPIHLHADPVRLAQVFSNLLNNACKYTPAKGAIRLSARREGGDVLVAVEDDGIGIPAERLGSVFDMFAQVDQGLERSQGGLGIGLTLVKRLVEMHGGSIEARSEGIGRGSSFVVRLPVLVESHEARDPEGAPAREQTATPLRILVVDDNRDAAESLAMLLEIGGHETTLAYDGLQAVEAAEKFAPDVMLLDLGLPELSGLDACRRIRAAPWGSSIVIIALSGWGQEGDRRSTTEAGFDHHLIKPVDHEALTNLLASLPAR